MKRKIFSLSAIMLFGLTVSAQHKLVKKWETPNNINMPESVLHDPKSGLLYVSIMGNSSDAKDGIGGIGILDANGKAVDLEWITGLNAPKGLAIHRDLLYIADITDVVIVNIAQRKVIHKIPVEGAVFLNDVTVSDKGVVYISDSRTKRIHQLQNNKVTVYLENIEGVNGLKSIGDELYIAGGGKGMIKADGKKNLTKVATLPQGGDGIEPVGNGDFIYSSWPGYIYYVFADGRFELLLDTHLEKINTADIGYDPVKRVIYVPTFFKKSVMAYQLQ
jgi:sugar lactone lactonase YvrE